MTLNDPAGDDACHYLLSGPTRSSHIPSVVPKRLPVAWRHINHLNNHGRKSAKQPSLRSEPCPTLYSNFRRSGASRHPPCIYFVVPDGLLGVLHRYKLLASYERKSSDTISSMVHRKIFCLVTKKACHIAPFFHKFYFNRQDRPIIHSVVLDIIPGGFSLRYTLEGPGRRFCKASSHPWPGPHTVQ